MNEDLIDRKELLYKYGRLPLTDEEADGIWHCIAIVKELPTVDAVQVVRCKDCKYRGDFGRCPMAHSSSGDPPYDKDDDFTVDDGFCNFGEKKEEE